ncbi:MAG: condensation domain-containing protein [Clostridioides sp.]|nr:condensation domain-containing protein [Clostridioides sp.]
MSRNNYNSDFSYWEELLLDYTNFAKVPNDYFNESYDFDIVEESICFSDEISRGLSNFLNRYEINFEVFFMLIYGLILEKYTYEEDVVFGVTKDVLPIRVNYTNKMSFLESLKLLQNQYLNTLEKYSNSSRNKELFLEYLNNKSALKDKLINTVLFWNDKDEYRFVSNDLNVKIDFSYENTKVHLIYNANVYSVEKIRRILNMFEGITKQVLENENIDVCRLKFISDEEKKRILTHFDDTKKDYDFEKDYISLFRKSATDYAYNIAVEDDNHFMS